MQEDENPNPGDPPAGGGGEAEGRIGDPPAGGGGVVPGDPPGGGGGEDTGRPSGQRRR